MSVAPVLTASNWSGTAMTSGPPTQLIVSSPLPRSFTLSTNILKGYMDAIFDGWNVTARSVIGLAGDGSQFAVKVNEASIKIKQSFNDCTTTFPFVIEIPP